MGVAATIVANFTASVAGVLEAGGSCSAAAVAALVALYWFAVAVAGWSDRSDDAWVSVRRGRPCVTHGKQTPQWQQQEQCHQHAFIGEWCCTSRGRRGQAEGGQDDLESYPSEEIGKSTKKRGGAFTVGDCVRFRDSEEEWRVEPPLPGETALPLPAAAAAAVPQMERLSAVARGPTLDDWVS
eukprot:gene23925-31716_t